MSIRAGFLATGLFIDGFAGGGGASTGIAQAIGREVDIAVNHSQAAIAIHKANHPATTHYCQDIRAVWPLAVTRMQPVAGAWFSPDCKEYSKAKGAPVKDRSIRALADEVVIWLRDVQPTVAYLENVEEFEYAAPLDAEGRPIKGQEGRAFRRLVRQWRGQGYRVQWRVLRACDYGTPTSRKRLYVVMRRDGLPIVWPKPTHGAPGSPGVRSGRLQPYRTAAECIDWSIPCPSIFDRKRELADATKRRVAHGVMRYVVQAAAPFIVPNNTNNVAKGTDEPVPTITTGNRNYLCEPVLAPHITKFRSGSVGAPMDRELPTVTANGVPTRQAGASPLGMVGATLAPFITYGQQGGATRSIAEPHHTIAASSKDQNCVAAASLIQVGWGERKGQAPRVLDTGKPLGTIMADGNKHAAVAAFLSTFYTNGGRHDLVDPAPTITAGSNHHAVVCAHMEQANTGRIGHPIAKPISTVTANGAHQRLVETTLVEADALPPAMLERATTVAAFLVKYYGMEEAGHSVAKPLGAVTGKDRFAVVTVTIDAVTYVIVDIGLRMLKPRELARAQGFPDDYVLDPECWYLTDKGNAKFGRLPVSHQISAIGNSVCPPMARALVTANQPGLADLQAAA